MSGEWRALRGGIPSSTDEDVAPNVGAWGDGEVPILDESGQHIYGFAIRGATWDSRAERQIVDDLIARSGFSGTELIRLFHKGRRPVFFGGSVLPTLRKSP